MVRWHGTVGEEGVVALRSGERGVVLSGSVDVGCQVLHTGAAAGRGGED